MSYRRKLNLVLIGTYAVSVFIVVLDTIFLGKL